MSLQLIPQLHKATHQVGLYISRHHDSLGVSQAEAHVLSHLADSGSCSIAQLHASFGHKRSTLTSILNRLEERGLLARELHMSDRRSYMIQLTRAGKPLAKRAHAALERLEQRVTKQLGSGDLKGFVAVLEAIAAAAGDD